MRTQGPWTVEEYLDHNDNPCISVMGADGETVYVVECATAEDRANANLISASPELYEALKWLTHLLNGVSKSGDTVISNSEYDAANEAAKTALAKARGEK